MKRAIKISPVVLMLLLSSFIFGQQNADYIRWTGKASDGSGHYLPNKTIKVQVLLRFGNKNSNALYFENHNVKTDSKGSFTLLIGSGEVEYGVFDQLPWGSKKSYAKIMVNGNSIGIFEIHKKRDYNKFNNPNVNNVIKNTGPKGAQLERNINPVFKLSLGNDVINAGEGIQFFGSNHNYTIQAKNSINLTAGEGLEITGTYPNYTVQLKKHHIGEHYLGGIIFWLDDSKQHGLIVKDYNERKYSIGTWATFPWEPSTKTFTLKQNDPGLQRVNAYGHGIGSGRFNTMMMLAHDPMNNRIQDIGEYNSIPEIFLSGNFIAQWYLPSIDELKEIYKQKQILKEVLNIANNNHIFWSSTEGKNDICAGHGDGPLGENLKTGDNTRGKVPNKISLNKDSYYQDNYYVGKYPGALAINFYTGKILSIGKFYSYSFVLIRDF